MRIKKLVLSLFIIVILGCGDKVQVDKSQGEGIEIKKTYYSSGKLKWEQKFVNGELNGPSKGYYKNGKLERELTFKNGKPDGLIKDYYENGNLEKERDYTNGKMLNGRMKIYRENGNIQGEAYYTDGKTKELKRYFESGSLKDKRLNYIGF